MPHGRAAGCGCYGSLVLGQVEIVVSTCQFIHARVVNGSEAVNLVVVYASPSVSRRSG